MERGEATKDQYNYTKSATEEINPTDEGIKKKAISERISRALGLSGRDEIFKLYQNKPIGE